MSDHSPGLTPNPNRVRIRLLLLGIVVLIFGGMVLFWPRGFSLKSSPMAKTLLPGTVAVAPGVFLLGKSTPAAVYLVQTSEGLVLIDSGLDAKASDVIAQIDQLGFDVDQIKAILLTHVHADHSLGATYLKSLSGAKIYAGQADSQILRQGGPREMYLSIYRMPHITPHKVLVDVELKDEDVIEFAETKFHALVTPGHTPGSTCYLMERGDLRVLFTGDVVQNLSHPENGQMGTYAAHLAPFFGGNAKDYLATLQRLRAMPLPNLVLPGHPSMDEVPQDPHLTEAAWHALLDVGIQELKALQARFQTDGANFLDGNAKELLPGLHYLGNVGTSAVYCLSTPRGLFLVNAPGGKGLIDLLTNQFERLGWKDRPLIGVLLTSDKGEMAGTLDVLVNRFGCTVMGPKFGIDKIRRVCPSTTKILSEEDFESSGWFKGKAIRLDEGATSQVAYQLDWNGITVLFTGGLPIKPGTMPLKRSRTDFSGNELDVLKFLDHLATINPRLWLPAIPLQGQNANLYDKDWPQAIDDSKLYFLR